MQLTDHFHLREFLASKTAAENHITNQPTEAETENLRRLAIQLEWVRNLIGHPLLITSGFRSEELNARVGGHPRSYHRLGLAADFVPLGPRAPTVGATFTKLVKGLRLRDYREIAEIFEEHLGHGNGWIHFAVRPPQKPLNVGRYTLSGTGRRIYTPLTEEELT